MPSAQLEAALKYASMGWPVFPIHYLLKDGSCSCNDTKCNRDNPKSRVGKHPACKNGLKDATTDAELIRALWSKPYYNVGLATGHDNVVYLDIDTDVAKGKKGLDSIRQLEAAHGPLPPTLSQKTGSGGRHLAYRASKPLKNSQSKLGPGLDTRGAGGYVILPPSNHASGGRYEWLNDLPIAPMPDWLEAALSEPDQAEVDISTDAPQQFSKKEIRVKLTLEEATILLKWIDYDDRDMWWTTGAALKTEFEEAGYAVWDEWSQGSDKYDAKVARRQWDSFKEGLYTAGTLLKYAKDGGFRGFDEEMADSPEFKENWLWVGVIKRFIELNTMLELDAESFDGKFAFNFKKTSASKAVLRNEVFPRVDSITYWPSKERIVQDGGITKLNLWRPSGVVAEAGNVDFLLDHVAYLYPEPEEQNILLDYLAFQVQHPGELVHWAILLQGLPGNGKSYFGHLMSCVLGAHNVRMVNSEIMHDNFTEWQKATQFVVVEEIMARGRLELMNKLKPLITQPIINVQEKFKPTYEMAKRYNFLFLTNHADALILDSTDRRYCILASHAGPHCGGRDYYGPLFDRTAKMAGAILANLLKRDLTRFEAKGHAPMTEGKRMMIEESIPALDSWIRDKVDNQSWPFSVDLINPADLPPIAREFGFHTNPKEIGKAFSRLGYTSLGRRYVNGKADYLPLAKVYLTAVRNAEGYKLLDPEALRAAFAKQDNNAPKDGAGSREEQRYADGLNVDGNQVKKTRPM